MEITAKEIGIQGEIEVTKLLRRKGWEIRLLDRLGCAPDGSWYFIEVKNKEPWEPPPSFQQGLWTYQYTFYKQFHYLFSIRTMLVVKGKNGEWLAQFIDNLKPNNYRQLKDRKRYVFFDLNQFQPFSQFTHGLLHIYPRKRTEKKEA